MWETHLNYYWVFFWDGGPPITYSLVLHFSRLWLSQIVHAGDIQDVQFSSHMCVTKSNSHKLPPSSACPTANHW